jgi:hypothetical protein
MSTDPSSAPLQPPSPPALPPQAEEPLMLTEAPQTLAYATPLKLDPSEVLWRENDLLVMRSPRGSLPDRCVRCNAAAEGYRLSRTVYWHHPAYYVLIVWPGLLIYVIVAVIVRRKAQVELGLCPFHASRRRWAIGMGWLLAVGGIVLMVASAMLADDKFEYWWIVLILGIAALLAGVIWGSIGARTLWAKRITRDRITYLRGADPRFLSEFAGIVR